MATLTISPLTRDDPFYRYTMPRLKVRFEGRNTVLPNLEEVAKRLRSSSTCITKFFAIELSTNCKSEQSKHLLKGIYTSDILQPILDQFICIFVLCPRCELPEITLQVRDSTSKAPALTQSCAACGHKSVIQHDSHKLVRFYTQFLQPQKPGSKTKAARRVSVQSLESWLSANLLATDDEITMKLDDLCLDRSVAISQIVEVLLANNLAKGLVSKKQLLRALVSGDQSSQKVLLEAVEHVLITKSGLDSTSAVFQILYLEDLVDEEVFYNWKDTILSGETLSIVNAAQPFYEWLRSATEDSESSEDTSG